MNPLATDPAQRRTLAFSTCNGILFGQTAGIRDGVGFHAGSVEELRAAFHASALILLQPAVSI